MKLLVTGGAGFVRSNLIRHLLTFALWYHETHGMDVVHRTCWERLKEGQHQPQRRAAV